MFYLSLSTQNLLQQTPLAGVAFLSRYLNFTRQNKPLTFLPPQFRVSYLGFCLSCTLHFSRLFATLNLVQLPKVIKNATLPHLAVAYLPLWTPLKLRFSTPLSSNTTGVPLLRPYQVFRIVDYVFFIFHSSFFIRHSSPLLPSIAPVLES